MPQSRIRPGTSTADGCGLALGPGAVLGLTDCGVDERHSQVLSGRYLRPRLASWSVVATPSVSIRSLRTVSDTVCSP